MTLQEYNNYAYYFSNHRTSMHVNYAKNTTGYQALPIKRLLNMLYWLYDYFDNAKTIVDLGCGYGLVLEYLRTNFNLIRTDGIEYVSEFIKEGERIFPRVNFINKDLTIIPSFKQDIIYTFNCMYDDHKRNYLFPIIDKLKPHQLFIEVYDSNDYIYNSYKNLSNLNVQSYQGMTIINK